jgi:hypothetical protein
MSETLAATVSRSVVADLLEKGGFVVCFQNTRAWAIKSPSLYVLDADSQFLTKYIVDGGLAHNRLTFAPCHRFNRWQHAAIKRRRKRITWLENGHEKSSKERSTT